MTIDDERVTVAERYATATRSSDLSPPTTRRLTDAEVLLAAGIAASGDARKSLALRIYRLGVTGDTTNLWSIVEEADGWLHRHLDKRGRHQMPKAARRALVVRVLQVFMDPRCDYCYGNGKVAEEEDGRKVHSACPACGGTGLKPLAREVPRVHRQAAEWLLQQIHQQAAIIHAEMARLLAGKIKDAGL